MTEGNYLLLPDGGWPKVRSRLAEVWYCDLDDDLRKSRLAARHVQFGKRPADARRWALGTDQANAEHVAMTRESADLVVPIGALSAIGGEPSNGGEQG